MNRALGIMTAAVVTGCVRSDMPPIESFADSTGDVCESQEIPPEIEAAQENLETRLRELGVVFGSDTAQMTALDPSTPSKPTPPQESIPTEKPEAVVPGEKREEELLLEEGAHVFRTGKVQTPFNQWMRSFRRSSQSSDAQEPKNLPLRSQRGKGRQDQPPRNCHWPVPAPYFSVAHSFPQKPGKPLRPSASGLVRAQPTKRG